MLAVLAMSGLIGFAAVVVDIGLLFVNRAELVNIADAAALAGVQDLPGSRNYAVSNAKSYAGRNGRAGDTVAATVANDDLSITVQARRTVPLGFAKIFGLSSYTVGASAKATVRPLKSASGIVPFGIVWQDFQFGQRYSLKEGAGSGYHGNYGALALGGNGASTYRNNIKYGYDSELKIGDWVSTEPGNMSGPTSDGVNYRVSQDPASSFETVSRSSARIVTVPVIDSLPGHGRGDVQIVGFAAFYLEGVGGQGNSNYVSGKFLQMIAPGQVSDSGSGYGLYGTKLVQ